MPVRRLIAAAAKASDVPEMPTSSHGRSAPNPIECALWEANADGALNAAESRHQAPGHLNEKTLAPRSGVANRRSNVHSLLAEPDVQVGRVESHEAPYLEKRDPSFADQALNVARSDAQCFRNAVDVDER